jgi:integrase
LELRLARWSDFDGRTLTIGRSRTKATARRSRTVEVAAATAAELRAWQLESGGRGDQPIVGEMTQNALKLWARRHLPVGLRLYDLRHSHASALHYAGYTVPEAAERLGHGPGLHVETYAHVIRGMTGTRYDGLDELVTAARAELKFPQASPRAAER